VAAAPGELASRGGGADGFPMTKPSLQMVHGQPSWVVRSSHVHACLTRLGGHLGPVAFRLGNRTVSPFSVAPWAEEPGARETIPLLRALRGDFFCAPEMTWRW
jgi:hypothetical protein